MANNGQRIRMNDRMSISKLANVLAAPRKTINDWSNSNDHKHLIVEVLQEIGENELMAIMKRIDEREGIKRYSQIDLAETFISIFPNIEKLAIDYQNPNLEGQPSLVLKHKTDDTKRMMVLFKNRLPNLIKLREQVTGYYNNFLALASDGITVVFYCI